jgi:DNA uptake protein ComE-like DNA-binding protein
MKDKMRDLFTFSSGERKGIIALVFVLIVICGINMILMQHHPVPLQSKYPEWMKDTGAFEEADNISAAPENDFCAESLPAGAGSVEQKSIIDPNSASLEDLLLTGFNLRIARTIVNYRKKGGKFRTPDELKKIYGLTPEIFQSVEPFIRINDMTSRTMPIIETAVTIKINTADSVLFEKLPGIGPVLARRILRYRTALGGYYSPEQIREVYGISDSLFLTIRERLEADTARIKKINLNTAAERDLAHHPYIGKYVSAGIIKYRRHAGKILNINELIMNGLIPKDQYDKLKYYVSL